MHGQLFINKLKKKHCSKHVAQPAIGLRNICFIKQAVTVLIV